MAYSAYYMQHGRRSQRHTDWPSVVVFCVVGFSVALALLSLTYMVVTGVDPTSLMHHEREGGPATSQKPHVKPAAASALAEDPCRNRQAQCEEWAAAGECENNRAFMVGDEHSGVEGQCCRACGRCGECWAGAGGAGARGGGYFPRDSARMAAEVEAEERRGGGEAEDGGQTRDNEGQEQDAAALVPPEVVIVPKPCRDIEPKCGEWAAGGECQSNPPYMTGDRALKSVGQCCKACQKCGPDCYQGEEYMWTEAVDEAGHLFWYNAVSHESTRKDPYGQWVEAVDPASKKTFWSNPATGESTWESPVGKVSLACADKDAQCAKWAQDGYCTTNRDFMLGHAGLGNEGNCCKSCGCEKCWITAQSRPPTSKPTAPEVVMTPRQCSDVMPDCPNWARDGFCATNAGYMLGSDEKNVGNCCKSCGACNNGCWMNVGPLA